MAPTSWRLFLVLPLMLSGVKGDSITGWTTPCGSFLSNVQYYLRYLEKYHSKNVQNCYQDSKTTADCAAKFLVTSACGSKEDLSGYSAKAASNCGEVTSFQSSFSSCLGSETFCADAGEGSGDCLASIYTNDCKEGGSEACQASLVTVSKKGTDKYAVKSAFVTNCKGGKTFKACSIDGRPPWNKGSDDTSDSSARKWVRKWKWYLIGALVLFLVGFIVCGLCFCFVIARGATKGRRPSSSRRRSSRGRRRPSGRSKVIVNTVVQNTK